MAIIRNRAEGKKHSILELKGLGKDMWGFIDAQEYVNRERDSWVDWKNMDCMTRLSDWNKVSVSLLPLNQRSGS